MEHSIYIVEDDEIISSALEKYLCKYGYDVQKPDNFEDIMPSFKNSNATLVLLDINLPKYDGFYWCKKIRQQSNIPIIFISARDSGMDQIMALESGADDYIMKPFNIDVVIARIKSFIRRVYGDYAQKGQEKLIEIDDLKFYQERLQIEYKEEKLILTQKEGILLEHLMTMYPKVVSRDFLFEKVWDDIDFIEENTLNVNISRLRRRFDSLGLKNVIETVWGVGYKLNKTW